MTRSPLRRLRERARAWRNIPPPLQVVNADQRQWPDSVQLGGRTRFGAHMVERVLIVDDDSMQRRLVENIVRKAGYETASVDGGEAALKAMLATASTPYDCVVLDLAMPDLDGLGVLGRMREAGLKIPVIVQTARRGMDNVVAAMRAGAADFVV